MPTRKIAEAPRVCLNPEHEPPKFMVWEPGTYKHTCPGCGHKTVFTVDQVIA